MPSLPTTEVIELRAEVERLQVEVFEGRDTCVALAKYIAGIHSEINGVCGFDSEPYPCELMQAMPAEVVDDMERQERLEAARTGVAEYIDRINADYQDRIGLNTWS